MDLLDGRGRGDGRGWVAGRTMDGRTDGRTRGEGEGEDGRLNDYPGGHRGLQSGRLCEPIAACSHHNPYPPKGPSGHVVFKVKVTTSTRYRRGR